MPEHQNPYYASLNFPTPKCFRDLDLDDVYCECYSALKSPQIQNFIVDFGGARENGGEAWCAVDVGPDDVEGVKALLNAERKNQLRTRWINIFDPYSQAKLVSTITSHYGFSPRLTKVITTPPAGTTVPNRQPPERRPSRRSLLLQRYSQARKSYAEEREREMTSLRLPPEAHMRDGMSVQNALEMIDRHNNAAVVQDQRKTYMDLAQSVWHWQAVEWGGDYICTGFNHLHQVPSQHKKGDKMKTEEEEEEIDEEKEEEGEFDTGNNDPEGKRVWSWLILCADGTVIFIHEPLGNIPPDDLIAIRRNILSVFRSLSLSTAAQEDSVRASVAAAGGMEDYPFRTVSKDGDNVRAGPSLLLYYLFDDYQSLWSFVHGRGHPYSTQMRNLRNRMHRDPRLGHLKRLHHLTRQLAVLKRLYESRKIILENILYRQENSPTSGHRTLHATESSSIVHDSHSDVDSEHERSAARAHAHRRPKPLGSSKVLGVKLSGLAIARFERLRDRIRLYVLGELDALLVEKSELENLTFNLISLKQAGTVELLTRVTIYLTLFTIVCLPLTLVTGYFSMQLKDVEGVYSQKTFWGSAGVSLAITVLVLYTVSKGTGVMEIGSTWDGFANVWLGWGNMKRRAKMRKEKRRKEARISKEDGNAGGNAGGKGAEV